MVNVHQLAHTVIWVIGQNPKGSGPAVLRAALWRGWSASLDASERREKLKLELSCVLLHIIEAVACVLHGPVCC